MTCNTQGQYININYLISLYEMRYQVILNNQLFQIELHGIILTNNSNYYVKSCHYCFLSPNLMVVRRFSRLYNHHGTRLKDRIPPFHPYFYNNIIFNLLCHKRTPNQKSSTQTNPTQPIFPFTHVSNFISPKVIISIYLNFHKLHYIVWQF